MSWRTVGLCAVGAGICLAAALFSPPDAAIVHAAAPVAFTAEMLTTTVDQAYGEMERKMSVFAQRSDGSSVRMGEPAGARQVRDAVRRKIFSVDPAIRMFATFDYSGEQMEFDRSSPATCESKTNLALVRRPQERILGFEVQRYSGMLIEGKNPVSRWLAPGLNCFILREELDYADRRYNYRMVRMATSLKMGEPDSALFEVPLDYKEQR